MSKLPIVSIKVQHGLSVVTLSTMGDTTHVQTDTGACFHVNQLSEDSVYFRPARTILKQARELRQSMEEVSFEQALVDASRKEVQKNVLELGAIYLSHERLKVSFDLLAQREVRLAASYETFRQIQEDIKMQNRSTRIANGDGTFTEILEG